MFLWNENRQKNVEKYPKIVPKIVPNGTISNRENLKSLKKPMFYSEDFGGKATDVSRRSY